MAIYLFFWKCWLKANLLTKDITDVMSGGVNGNLTPSGNVIINGSYSHRTRSQ